MNEPMRSYDDACAGVDSAPDRQPVDTAVLHPQSHWCTCPECRIVAPDRPPVDPISSRVVESNKDTNPKDAVGVRKAPLSTVPAQVIMEIGLGLLEGAVKYRRHNYRVVGVKSSVYYDATMRHLMAWWEGEDLDPDSGLSHVTKALSSLTVLRDAMIQKKLNDDRPPPTTNNGWVAELNKKAGEILDRYRVHLPPYTRATSEKPR